MEMDKARVIEVVETTLLRRGNGETEPVRIIIQYWSREGYLLAEHDTLPRWTVIVNGSSRRVCRECNWRGRANEILATRNPFEPGTVIYACPACKEIGQLRTTCDEPGCWEEDTIGQPVPDGYRRTCHKHDPSNERKADGDKG